MGAKLPELLSKDSDEVIASLSMKEQEFNDFLTSEFNLQDPMKKKQFITLFDVIAKKLCTTTNLQTQRTPLVAKCCNSTFLNQLKDLILSLSESSPLPSASTSAIDSEGADAEQNATRLASLIFLFIFSHLDRTESKNVYFSLCVLNQC